MENIYNLPPFLYNALNLLPNSDPAILTKITTTFANLESALGTIGWFWPTLTTLQFFAIICVTELIIVFWHIARFFAWILLILGLISFVLGIIGFILNPSWGAALSLLLFHS